MTNEMQPDEVIVITETHGHDAAIVEVFTAKPDTDLTATDAGHHAAVTEVIEAFLDPAAHGEAAAGNVEVHEYVVVEEGAPGGVHIEPADSDLHDAFVDGSEGPSFAATNEPEHHSEEGHSADSVDETAAFGGGADHLDSVSATDDFSGAHAGAAAESTTSDHTDDSAADAHAADAQADAEAQAHSDAAGAAQERADNDVAAGDYASAAHERADAENESWQAGSSDMLHGSTSEELGLAGDQHDQADHYEHQEALDAQSGNYEAAREDASNAASQQGWADYNAGGSDHTGQAHQEYNQEDWAVWEQGQANEDHHDAEAYAAQGDFDHAAQYEDGASAHQDMADHHGDLGDHESATGVHDPSSDVAHDSYDSSHDASYEAPVDTSHDAGESYEG